MCQGQRGRPRDVDGGFNLSCEIVGVWSSDADTVDFVYGVIGFNELLRFLMEFVKVVNNIVMLFCFY